MNFSILIPTRGRPQLLAGFMKSVIERTSDVGGVEFLIKIDDDDIGSDYPDLLANYFKGINYRLFIEGRSDNLSQDYYNYLAKRATGRFVWAVNDDCILHGCQGWDDLVIDRVHKAGLTNKISYINVGMSGHTDIFSPFPMLSQEAISALGYFHHHRIKTWDADVILWNTFEILRDHDGINRMIDCRDKLTIIHKNINNDIGDETSKGMRRNHCTGDGINAGGFKDAGLYIPAKNKLLTAIVERGL